MAEGTMSLADIAAIGSDGRFGGGWMGAGLGLIGGLILASIFGGNGLFGNRGYGSGYGAASSNEVQRGFDNQNSMANQREILGAVTGAASQSVAATNQVFHDLVGYVGDKYAELDRDVLGVSAAVQQAIANQNECCCNTRMAIQETAAQNRYDALLNTNSINANILASNQKVLDALAQNKIDALQNRINVLELAQATQNTVKYPTSMSYNAGPSPFCNGCGCGCGY